MKRLLSIFTFIFLLSAYGQFDFSKLNGNGPAMGGDQEILVTPEVLLSHEVAKPGDTVTVGIKYKMKEHWHIYWENPGVVGQPTQILYPTKPEWLVPSQISWPLPVRDIVTLGEGFDPLVSYYYGNEVILTQTFEIPKGTQEQTVDVRILTKWLACKEQCIPGEENLEFKLKIGQESALTKDAETLHKERQILPELNQATVNFTVEQTDAKTVVLTTTPQLDNADFFPLIVKQLDPQNLPVAKDNKITITFKEGVPESLVGLVVSSNELPDSNSKGQYIDIDLKGNGNSKALDANDADDLQLGDFKAEADDTTVIKALLLAFFGGLLLNLMPCVLPVVSLKVLSFVEQAGDAKNAWKHGVAFTVGVLVSFWTLAGTIIVLSQSSSKFGWGFQLQSPVFNIFLVFLLFIMGLSFFGVFEFGMSLMSVGQGKAKKKGLQGSFWSGMLATIVATPCTGPGMGVALGFALAQPSYITILVFTALGIGMSSPYLLLGFKPSLMKYIPKPGPWMETFKQFMGFLLVATVIWLVSVVGALTSPDVVIAVLAGLMIASMGAWVFGQWATPAKPLKTQRIATCIALVLLIAGIQYSLKAVDTFEELTTNIEQSETQISQKKIKWQVYKTATINEKIAAKESFFIDFTADWCLSCKANEAVALTSEVGNKLEEKGIIAYKADWTRRDEEITKALKKFGRSGVPLYVLFDGKTGEFKILPQVLTEDIVLDALDKL
ncbi:MAG: thioredoxin family protein [Lentisphaeria bacterium]|nr:thioredoxin family protein [Lentisphaeria bacterium]